LKPKTIQEWRIGYAPDKWHALSEFLGSRGYSQDEILKTGLSVKKGSDLSQDSFQQVEGSSYDRFRHRIIFPICDLNGVVIGFSGRIFGEGEPKYINTPNTLIYDKSRVLYGLDRAKLDIRKKNLCILVEGQMDVIMSHQADIKNVVASSGTALTEGHLRIIKRYTENLAMAFDMDLAGETATKRSADLAIAAGFNTKVIQMPTHQDPADCLKDDPSVWLKAIQKARSIIEFYFLTAFSQFNPALVEGKKEIAKTLLPILKRIPNKIEQSHWLQELGRRLNVEEKVLAEEMKQIKWPAINITSGPLVTGPRSEYVTSGNAGLGTEEYLLGLLLVNSQLLEDFKNQPSYLFTNSDLAEIFKKIKKSQTVNLKSLQKDLPIDLASRIEYLVFRAETDQIDQKEDFDPKKEIEFCFTQLKNRYLRQKMSQLNLAIKEAEDRKDKTALKSLTEEFNKLSKQLADI
jgi:DNA primase